MTHNLRPPVGLTNSEALEWAASRRRLEELRLVLRSESISYGELAELQGLAAFIEPGDVELLEPAGVPEFGASDA